MSGTGDAGRRVVITYAATPPMPRVTDEEDAPRSVEPDTVLATSPALLSGESPSSPVVVQDRRFVGPLPVICAMDTAAVAGATSGDLRWATPSRAKVMPAAPARVQGGTVTVVEHAAGCDKSSASASASTSTQLSRGVPAPNLQQSHQPTMLWQQHASLPAHTCVSFNVMDALLAMDGASAAGVHEGLRHEPLDKWPVDAATFFFGVDPGVLLAADAGGNDVEVRTSTIPGAGQGVFALRDFVKGERILPFWGVLVFEDLSDAASSRDARLQSKLYGTGRFSTTARNWLETATQVCTSRGFWDARMWRPGRHPPADSCVATKHCHEFCRCSARAFIPAWVVPSSSCAAGKVNDARRNKTPGSGDTVRAAAKRKANLQLRHRSFPVSATADLVRADVVILLVTKHIRRGDEMFLPYGRSYGGM